MVRRVRRKPSPAEQLVAQGQEIEYPKRTHDREAGTLKTDGVLLQSAIAKYSEAIELDPQLIDAYIRRAAARQELGDRRGSQADAMVAYGLRPRDPMDYLLISFPFPRAEQRQILRTGIAKARPGSFEHLQLGLNVGLTYWYEGRFDLELRATLRLLRQFEAMGKSRQVAGLHYQAGTALMAMGRFAAAERQLRSAFRDRATMGMLARTSVVESYLYRDDLDGALRVLDEVASRLDPSLVALTRAYIRALGPEPLKISKALEAELLVPDRASRHDYMGAVILLRLGRGDVAKPRLRRFIDQCEANPREWGVTMRWEIAKAKELLARSDPARTRSSNRRRRKTGKPLTFLRSR
jgi:tetratricopeptide (TPR) repeat protein